MFYSNNLANFEKKEINVKQYIRKGKLVRSSKRKIDKKKLAIKTLVPLLSALGLTAGTYLLLKNRYRSGYAKSANIALKRSKMISTLDLKDNVENIHFATGGFNAKSEDTRKSLTFARKLKDVFNKDLDHIIPVDTSDSNVNFLGRDYKNKTELAINGLRAWSDPFLNKGYNETSRQLASEMYAYQSKYPDKQLILHGFSSGSFINTEALNIFKEMGGNIRKVKQVNYVGTYLGINKPNLSNTLSLASKADWDYTATKFHYPNTTWIPNKSEHSMSEYLSDSKVVDQIKKFISYSTKQNKTNVTPDVKEQVKGIISNQVKNNNEKSKEDIQKALIYLQERRRKLAEVRNNSRIPEAKKEQALRSAKQELQKARNKTKMAINDYRKS
jgi:hypothetical protein